MQNTVVQIVPVSLVNVQLLSLTFVSKLAPEQLENEQLAVTIQTDSLGQVFFKRFDLFQTESHIKSLFQSNI